jgi:hypothetical protein
MDLRALAEPTSMSRQPRTIRRKVERPNIISNPTAVAMTEVIGRVVTGPK